MPGQRWSAGRQLSPAACIPEALPEPWIDSVAWRQGAAERRPEAPSPFADADAAGAPGQAHAPATAGGDGGAERAHDAGHLVSRGMSKRGVQGTQLMRSAAESDSALLLGGDLGVVVVQARLQPKKARVYVRVRPAAKSDSALLLGGDLGVMVVQAGTQPARRARWPGPGPGLGSGPRPNLTPRCCWAATWASWWCRRARDLRGARAGLVWGRARTQSRACPVPLTA
jgi:hypothetical protein